MEICVVGFVGSILSSVIKKDLQRKLEKFFEKEKAKRLMAELKKTALPDAIRPYKDKGNTFYDALDAYIAKNDIVSRLIKHCHDYHKGEYTITAKEFVKKE